ncbi:MAG: peptidase MA family metallohydrolase [bacterium]
MNLTQLKYIALLLFPSLVTLPTKWFTLESPLFKIYYAESDEKIAEQLSTMLETGYGELGTKLGVDLVKPVKVFLCPSEHIFNELTGKHIPDWGEGVADPVRNLIIIKSPSLANTFDTFHNLVLHELTHILVGQAVEHPEAIPRWFNEGIAVYFSKEQEFSGGKAISKALISNSLVPLDEIDDVLDFQKEKARLAYEESYSAILFLEEKFGYEALTQLIRGLKNQGTFNTLFLDSFGLDLIDFEWEWNQYVEKKYRWHFLLDFETYLWILILLLFLSVILAIKFRNRKTLKKWDEEERLARS